MNKLLEYLRARLAEVDTNPEEWHATWAVQAAELRETACSA